MTAQQPVSYGVQGEYTSPRFAQAFAAGCGGRLTFRRHLEPGPAAIFGSPQRWTLIQRAMNEQRCYYGDHGYFGRGVFFRITRNTYQHDGSGAGDARRFARFTIPIRPWCRTGRHIVICPNGAEYFSLFGLNVEQWLAHVHSELSQHTDRPIVVRWKRTETPLAADLVDAWAVVAFSSNAAVEALLAGVPVFVLAPFAAAARMGLSDLAAIESPAYPEDRLPFAAALASHQWTLDEIAGGIAWRALQDTEVAHAA